MKLKKIISVIENIAPLSFQESYDNAGLVTGSPDMDIKAALISLDITEAIVDEAIEKGCNLILSHHPLVFKALKSITGKNFVERALIKAIQHNIAIYSAHTNLDSVEGGVNSKICEKLQLKNCHFLTTRQDELRKLVTFAPSDKAQIVRTALFDAGAGHIGNYDQCSYNLEGQGTFRALDNTNPYVGEQGKLHFENEIRIEVIYPRYCESAVVNALLSAHPYEEVAYDIYPLKNKYEKSGAGMVGELDKEVDETVFLNQLKETFKSGYIKHTALLGKKIKNVAICGGSGSFLIKNALQHKADIFISADIKYHDFFTAQGRMIIADVGHYESEQFTKEVLFDIVNKNFTNFAVQISEINTNPINYL